MSDEIIKLDSKNAITMFVQQASNKITVRQMSVMFGKCQHNSYDASECKAPSTLATIAENGEVPKTATIVDSVDRA